MPCTLVQRYHAQHAFKLADTLYCAGGLLTLKMWGENCLANILLHVVKCISIQLSVAIAIIFEYIIFHTSKLILKRFQCVIIVIYNAVFAFMYDIITVALINSSTCFAVNESIVVDVVFLLPITEINQRFHHNQSSVYRNNYKWMNVDVLEAQITQYTI